MEPIEKLNTSKGHRERLRERYLKNGIDALQQHEILELLLTFAIPRRDTKQIAYALLRRYKTINGVCNASLYELKEIAGIGSKSAVLLNLIRDIIAYCLKERYSSTNVISNRSDVENYLRINFGFRKDEYVAALFLNSANRVIQTDIIAIGTVNQCHLSPRMIIEKALRYGAAAIIIAHNHPAGTTTPSEQDWQITERLFTICKLSLIHI
ncbi:MAG: DNA repair protein RadC, partial [Chitinispirillaceae bacterium]|nr:DNA repair protein RadC [Chitinispirillaceae bacterium]